MWHQTYVCGQGSKGVVCAVSCAKICAVVSLHVSAPIKVAVTNNYCPPSLEQKTFLGNCRVPYLEGEAPLLEWKI